MLYAPHRPRLRAGPSVPLRFDRTQLPAGYFVWSDFGGETIVDQYGRRPIATTGAAFPFGASSAGVGVNWAGGGTTSRLNYPTFPIPAQFTMEAVLQIGTVQDENILCFINNGGSDVSIFDRQLALRSGGNFSLVVFTGSIDFTTGATAFAAGAIVHVAATYDGTTYRLYVNGVLDGTGTYGAGYGGYTNPVLCAGFQQTATGGGGGPFNQSTHVLLQAGMADRALSADEVLRRSLKPWAPMTALPSWFAGPDAGVTVALTGVAGTGSVGALGVSRTTAMTGVAGTGAVGTLAPSLSVALTGVGGAGAVGDVGIGGDKTVALTGVDATGQVGSVGTLVPSTEAVGGDDAPARREDVAKLSRRQRRLEREADERAARLRATLERAYRAATGGDEPATEEALAEAAEIAPPAVAAQIAEISVNDGIAQTLAGIGDAIAAIQHKKNVIFRDDDDLAMILSVF